MRTDSNKLCLWAILFAALLLGTPAWSQTNNAPGAPILVQQEFPTELEVGSIADLVIHATHPVGTTVVVDAPNTRRAELLGQTTETLPAGPELRTTFTLKYGFFRTGDAQLPTFQVVLDGAGATSSAATTPLAVRVTPALAPGEELSAPQGAVAMWVDDYTWLWIGGFLLFLFALGGITLYMRRKANEVLEVVPPRPAYDIAIEKLLELETSGLLERGDFMVFYVRLSETLREYLGERYAFPGTELTTTEISVRLADVKWPLGMELAEVKQILANFDMVKFGGVIPEVAQGKALLRRAMTVVELTKGRFRQPISSTISSADNETDPDVEAEESAPERPAPSQWQPPEESP